MDELLYTNFLTTWTQEDNYLCNIEKSDFFLQLISTVSSTNFNNMETEAQRG